MTSERRSLNVESVRVGAVTWTVIYNKLQQKQVTAHLGLRNSAAHGQYGDYSVADVSNMIAGVEQFLRTNPA